MTGRDYLASSRWNKTVHGWPDLAADGDVLRYGGTDGEDEDAGNQKGQDVSVHSKRRHSNLCVRKVQEAQLAQLYE